MINNSPSTTNAIPKRMILGVVVQIVAIWFLISFMVAMKVMAAEYTVAGNGASFDSTSNIYDVRISVSQSEAEAAGGGGRDWLVAGEYRLDSIKRSSSGPRITELVFKNDSKATDRYIKVEVDSPGTAYYRLSGRLYDEDDRAISVSNPSDLLTLINADEASPGGLYVWDIDEDSGKPYILRNDQDAFIPVEEREQLSTQYRFDHGSECDAIIMRDGNPNSGRIQFDGSRRSGTSLCISSQVGDEGYPITVLDPEGIWGDDYEPEDEDVAIELERGRESFQRFENEDDDGDTSSPGPQCVNQGGFMGFLSCQILTWSLNVIKDVQIWIADVLFATEPLALGDSADPIRQVWGNFRVIANMFLVIAFLVIIYSLATGRGD